MSEWKIPLSDLDYGPEEEAAVLEVLRGKWLSMGPVVQSFERDLAGYLGVKHAFAVANGTAALHLAFLALDIGPGTEVIQPAINFVAAANMTAAVGALPVFADVLGLAEPTIDPQEVERALTPRTKAVVVMHYGGHVCRMAELQALCRSRGLALVEDACHAIGAHYVDDRQRPPHGFMAGAIGDVGCFSFFSNKNLATGEGGMVVTNRDDLAQRLRLLRSHGMTSMSWDRYRGHASSYDVLANGFNYRFDELRAALGRCQLKRLPANNARRRALVAEYRSRLADLPGWVIPFTGSAGDSAAHLMVAVAPDPATRAAVVDALRGVGVQTSLHYPCITDFKVFQTPTPAAVPHSQAFARRAFTLPLFPTLTPDAVTTICDVVHRASRVA